MAIEPLDSVTRICLARELSPDTWLRLFREAKAKETNGKSALEVSTNAAALQAIDVLLPLVRNSGTPLTQSYLQACLVADECKRHLLKKLLEHETTSVNNPHTEMQENRYLECVAATLLASDPAVATKLQSSRSSSQALAQVRAAIRLLAISAQHQLSSLFLLMLQLLQVPQSPTIRKSANEGLYQSISAEISSCRNALLAVTSAAASLPYPFELAHRLLNKLERQYAPIAYRRSTFLRPATFPSMPIEIEILLQSTLQSHCQNASVTLAGSIAARLAMGRANSDGNDAASQQNVLTEWFSDVFQCCSSHAPSLDGTKSNRTEARWQAFAFGRLPALIHKIQSDNRFSKTELDWPAALEAALQICRERPQLSSQRDLSDWSKGMNEYLAKAENKGSQYSAESLLGILEDGLRQFGMQATASIALVSQLSTWAVASDIPTIHHFLLALVKETPRIVDYVLMHSSVESLFKPICRLLDVWDSSEEYGAGQAMELYGGILLVLKTLVHRHSLQEGFSKLGLSISSAIIAPSSALAKVHSLSALSSQHQTLISSWITAFYGSGGIEDDLIRSTSPHAMLLLAPTIVHQSVTAMENGIIDQETLLNGLSYFCQDFLTFTLPGIICYLADQKNPNLQIIKPLLMSDSTPACVLELVQDQLREMLKKMDRPDEDVKLLYKKVKNGPIALPLDGTGLTSSLSTGTYAVQHIMASSQRTACGDEVVAAALQAHDTFTSSSLISQAIRPLNAASIKAFAIKATLQARDQIQAEDDLQAQKMDRLADITSLLLIRAGLGVEVEAYQSLPGGFRERLSTWSPAL